MQDSFVRERRGGPRLLMTQASPPFLLLSSPSCHPISSSSQVAGRYAWIPGKGQEEQEEKKERRARCRRAGGRPVHTLYDLVPVSPSYSSSYPSTSPETPCFLTSRARRVERGGASAKCAALGGGKKHLHSAAPFHDPRPGGDVL